MTNSTVTTKISAAFLATVLLAGIIALSSPSFIVGTAQATSDNEKHNDDDDKESYGKDRDESRDEEKHNDDDDKESYGKDRDESRDEEKHNDDDDKESYGKDRD